MRLEHFPRPTLALAIEHKNEQRPCQLGKQEDISRSGIESDFFHAVRIIGPTRDSVKSEKRFGFHDVFSCCYEFLV